ncbi:spore coat protein U domain-containing protein [Dongshaea marina]|uniref:spore coat protein U domain-containing protein n=1 Tax=Dongshaea marina TaxID=2047966 RepID=UPI000D3E5C4A|nr:spore coat protein U domain-containing protein [Dongshaea marina]
MSNRYLSQLPTLILILLGSYAHACLAACHSSGIMNLSLSLKRSCWINSDAFLRFGNYNPQDPAGKDGQATLRISCPGLEGQAVKVSISGAHQQQYFQMHANNSKARSYHLRYSLHDHQSRSWSTPEHSVIINNRGVGKAIFNGHIPADQRVPAGRYSQTLRVEVSY